MHDDTIKSGKELAGLATDLLDSDIQQVVQIIMAMQRKYAHRANNPVVLDQLRDEVLTRLAEIDVLATVDPAPCFYGEPPIVEIIGKIDNPYFQGAFDHDQKATEVRLATKRGEDYLGQKEPLNTASKAAKRTKSRQPSSE